MQAYTFLISNICVISEDKLKKKKSKHIQTLVEAEKSKEK